MGTRKHYSDEFKIEAVRLVQQGHPVGQVARELGVGRGMLGRWRRQLEEHGSGSGGAFGGSKAVSSEQEVQELRRQLQRVSQERDILKKALAIFSAQR